MFDALRKICLPFKSNSRKRLIAEQSPSTRPDAKELDKAPKAVTVVTTEVVTSTDVASHHTQNVAVLGTQTNVLDGIIRTRQNHHKPSNSQDTLIPNELLLNLPLAPENLDAAAPDAGPETLRRQLREREKKLEEAQLILDIYRNQEDYLTKALAMKESTIQTMTEVTESRLRQVLIDIDDLVSRANRAEEDKMKLITKLAKEKERSDKAEEAMKTLSEELASERRAKELLETQIQYEQDNAPKKIKDLEEELSTVMSAMEVLSSQLASDRALRQADQRYAEQQRKRLNMLLDQARKKIPEKVQKKQDEADIIVGAPVAILRIGKWAEEDLGSLTPVMLNHMKAVVEMFSKTIVVKRIEYFMNDELYKTYDETRNKFLNLQRGGVERLAYHGTNQRNIDSYLYLANLVG
jgi:hypothetical protein